MAKIAKNGKKLAKASKKYIKSMQKDDHKIGKC